MGKSLGKDVAKEYQDRTLELVGAILAAQTNFAYSGDAGLQTFDGTVGINGPLEVLLANMGRLNETVFWATRNVAAHEKELAQIKSDVSGLRRLLGTADGGYTSPSLDEEPINVPWAVRSVLMQLCNDGKPIEAIKHLRGYTPCSLLAAKRYVDRVRAGL